MDAQLDIVNAPSFFSEKGPESGKNGHVDLYTGRAPRVLSWTSVSFRNPPAQAQN